LRHTFVLLDDIIYYLTRLKHVCIIYKSIQDVSVASTTTHAVSLSNTSQVICAIYWEWNR